jgi:L-rhamnose mutarotase
MMRFGRVIGLREDRVEDYRSLHRGAGVRDLLTAGNIRNFNIFLQRFPDGKLYEFAYFEYVGSDYEGDMARLAAEPRNVEWLKLCDPMQVPLPGSSGWTEMEQIFFNA